MFAAAQAEQLGWGIYEVCTALTAFAYFLYRLVW
jgi:hypothetical protein